MTKPPHKYPPRKRNPKTVPKPAIRQTRGGSQKAEINLRICTNSGLIGCTNDEIATLLGISRTTFYEHMSRDPKIGEAIDAGRNQGKATLRRLQWAAAQKGNTTMLIWLGKQMLGQKDKVEHGVDETLEDLLTRLADEDTNGRPGAGTKPAA